MVGNYSNVKGAQIEEWGPESEVDDPERMEYAQIEEMYVDNGYLYIGWLPEDKDDTLESLRVPIQSRDSWNEFVMSLPTWD